MKRLGWIIIGRTRRAWEPYHYTAARTRTEAIQKWCLPLRGDGWSLWDLLRIEGGVKAVRTYFTEAH